MNAHLGKTVLAACAAIGAAAVFAAETLNEDFGPDGFVYGKAAKHYDAKPLLGENKGTILFGVRFGEPGLPKNGRRDVMSLRTNSRLSVHFYTCDQNRTVLFSFSDNGGHTWRFDLPGAEAAKGKDALYGVSWDGTVVKVYLKGRCVAAGLQPIALDKLDKLHFGPYLDSWFGFSAWSDDIFLKYVKTYDTALDPAEVAKICGVEMTPLAEAKKACLVIPPGKPSASLPQLVKGNNPELSGTLPEHGAKYGWDEKNLYISFKSRFPGNCSIVEGSARTSESEPQMWGTESFEFRLFHGGHLYTFGGNVAGGTCEGKDENYMWNAPWDFKVSKAMNIDDTILWRGEVTIPWSSMELSAPPKDATINFGRSWKLPTCGGHSSYHLTGGGYADVKAFLPVKFAEAPAYELLERTDPSEGAYREKFVLSSTKPVKVTYEIALASLDGALAPMTGVKRTYDLKPGEPTDDTMEFATGVPGYDALLHTLSKDGRIVMREIVPYKLDEQVFKVTPLLLHGRVHVVVKRPYNDKIYLKDASGKVLAEADCSGKRELDIPFSTDYPTGTYSVADVKFDYPGLGEWAHQDFNPERIIPPFKPITSKVASGKVGGFEASFSERSYAWRDSLLLASTVSRDEEMLAGPIEILVGGKALKAKSFAVKSAKPHRVEFAGSAAEGGVSAVLDGWLEYDGVNWNTLEMTGEGGALAIRYRLKSKFAKFLHGARGGAWGLKTTQCVKDGTTTVGYYPFLWIGDQERGLCFFAETRRGWTANEKTAYTIEKGADETVVTVAVAKKLDAAKPLRIQFGLQATPMRPLSDSHPYDTIGSSYGAALNRPDAPHVVDACLMASDNVKSGDTASFFGDLDDAKGRMTGTAQQQIHKMLEPWPDVRFVPYTCARWLSLRYPEAAAYVNDWMIRPEIVLDNEGTGHRMVDMCPASKASDYYCWRFRKLLERLPKVNGIYCDFGTINECSNGDHGCDGRIPILAYREYVRRLVSVQLDHGIKKPIVMLHNTDCNQYPCLSFATHLYNGENVRQASSALLHDKKDILDSYGLEMFACELGTLPLGVSNGGYMPFDTLNKKNGGDEATAPYQFRMGKAAFAGSLIHDNFPSQNRGHFGLYDKVFRVYGAFGVGKAAKFVGYWKEFSANDGTGVYVSAYTDEKKVLAVIGHVDKAHQDQDVSITFDWAKLGLGSAAPTKATDTLTEPDPDYQWLYQRMKQYHVPVWRCSLDIGDFGTKVLSFDGKTLKYHLPFHSFGLVELVP